MPGNGLAYWASQSSQLLSVPMRTSPFGDSGTIDSASPDSRPGTYTYNDAGSTRRDHEGLVFSVPKHFPAVNGLRTEINLFKDVDFLKASDWTVDASSSMTDYQGPGEGFTVTNASAGSADVVSIGLLTGVSIEGRKFFGITRVRAGSASEVGNTAVLVIQQGSGGSSPSVSVTVTLTADWQDVTTPLMTGLASNVGVKWQWRSASTSDDFDFEEPTLVDVTNRSNQAAPLPIPLDTPHEYARELLSSLSGTGWTANGDGTYTHSSGTTGLTQAVSLDTGRKMVAGVTITGRTAGTVAPKFTGGSGVDGSAVSADSWQVLTVGSGNTTFSLVPTTDFDGTVTVSLKEAAPGIEQFSDTNGNTVASGVITAAAGDELHPFHFEQVKSGANRTRTHQVMDQYTPWSAADSVVANERRLPSDWMTNYNRQLGFYADGVGTTGGTEPDWSTATEPGDTVSDNGITWTAFWCTIRGLTIEPAATNNVTDSDSLSTLVSDNCTITPEAAIAPDGSRSASLVVGDGTGTHRAKKLQSVTSGATWTSSIYCKDNGDDETLRLVFWNGTSIVADIRLQPSTGAVTETTMTEVMDYTVESLIDGWYRLSVTVVTALTGTYTTMWYPTLQTDVTEGMYLWGAQVNLGHYTSRIKTTAGTVTRTTQEGAMTYPLANFDNDNFLSLIDMSFGVAIQDIAVAQSLVSVHPTNATSSLLAVTSAGRIHTSDGSSTPGASPSDSVNEIYRMATHHQDSNKYGLRWFRSGSASAEGLWSSSSFDGDYVATRDNIALCPSISIPVTFHGIRFMPGMDIQTTGDVTQYHSFDDLRYT